MSAVAAVPTTTTTNMLQVPTATILLTPPRTPVKNQERLKKPAVAALALTTPAPTASGAPLSAVEFHSSIAKIVISVILDLLAARGSAGLMISSPDSAVDLTSLGQHENALNISRMRSIEELVDLATQLSQLTFLNSSPHILIHALLLASRIVGSRHTCKTLLHPRNLLLGSIMISMAHLDDVDTSTVVWSALCGGMDLRAVAGIKRDAMASLHYHTFVGVGEYLQWLALLKSRFAGFP